MPPFHPPGVREGARRDVGGSVLLVILTKVRIHEHGAASLPRTLFMDPRFRGHDGRLEALVRVPPRRSRNLPSPRLCVSARPIGLSASAGAPARTPATAAPSGTTPAPAAP